MGVAARVAAVRRRPAHWRFGVPAAPFPAGSRADGGTGDTIGLTVELLLAGAWTDVSPFVYYNNRVTHTRGKPDETSQIQPQTAAFTINNRDGRFSPRNPLGPYYGQIGRNTPIRVSRLQNGIRRYRFYGEVPSWPTTWDISGRDVYATITAAGQMRRLFQGNLPLHSALYRTYVLGLTPGFPQSARPIAYWPCEDGENSTQIASGLTGGVPLTLSGQAPPTFATNNSFLCSLPLPLLSASIWTGAIPAYSGGTDNALRFLLSIPATGAYDTAILARLYTSGTVARLDMEYLATSNGALGLRAYDGSGNLLASPSFLVPSVGKFSGFNGLPVFLAMEMYIDSGNVNVQISYLPLLADAGVTFLTFPAQGAGAITIPVGAGTIGHATGFVINPDGHVDDTAVGHIVYQSTVDELAQVAEQFNAWILDSPANRFSRLCLEQNVPCAVIPATGINYGDPTTMGYQLNDTFTNLIQEPATTSAGLLFESRDQNALILRERGTLYNQAAKLTLDHSAHQLSGPLNPVDDDALTRNDVTVTRVGGSSNQQVLTSGTLSTQPPPNGVGDYPTTASISLSSDQLLPDQTGWRLHLGTVDQPRYPTVMINLRHPTFTGNLDLMNAALTIDIGDRIVITNPPAWMPPDPISLIVQGYSETLGVYEHDIAFNCSPEDPYKVAIMEDRTLGRADTDGSTLAVGVGPAATTLTVKTTTVTSPLWTTDPFDVPLDVNVGGERMTVTNITTNALATLPLGVDGTFESGVTGWTIGLGSALVQSSGAAHTGTFSGLASGPGNTTLSFTTPNIPVTPTVSYQAGLWILLQTGTIDQAAVRIIWLDARGNTISQIDSAAVTASPASWSNLTVAQPAPTSAASAQVQFHAHTPGTDTVYVDDVTFISSRSQAFTVMRSINGVVKPQAAGTGVRLWQPMVLAL